MREAVGRRGKQDTDESGDAQSEIVLAGEGGGCAGCVRLSMFAQRRPAAGQKDKHTRTSSKDKQRTCHVTVSSAGANNTSDCSLIDFQLSVTGSNINY